MMTGADVGDLIVLAADKNMEYAMKGILCRTRSLHIREISSQIFTHLEHDPGCLRGGHLFLKPYVNQYAHALVLFDYEGSGKDGATREDLEIEVENHLAESGWHDRAKAVVIEPELEMWVWSDSPHVDSILGWEGKTPSLRDTLRARRLLSEGQIKPSRPKEAMEYALRLMRKQRSSSLFQRIAERVSLDRCIDPSFLKLKSTLQKWFPVESV